MKSLLCLLSLTSLLSYAKTITIQPSQEWNYPKIISYDKFSNRTIPLKYSYNGNKCPFRKEESKDFKHFLQSARRVLSQFEKNDSECHVPSSNFQALDRSIIAYKQGEGVSDSAYGTAQSSQATCYNYKERYNQQLHDYTEAVKLNPNHQSTTFYSCSTNPDPETCATVVTATRISEMENSCANFKVNIKYENTIRLQTDSAIVINNLLQSAFERIQSPKCKGKFPKNIYKSLLQTSISAAGTFASISATGGTSLLVAQGANIMNMLIGVFSKNKSYVEALQEESEFKDMACFYYEVKRRVFSCDQLHTAAQLVSMRFQYEKARNCMEKINHRYNLRIPNEINEIFKTLNNFLVSEDDKRKINRFQSFEGAIPINAMNRNDTQRQKMPSANYYKRQNPSERERVQSPQDIEEQEQKNLERTRTYLNSILTRLDARFDRSGGDNSFGDFVNERINQLNSISDDDERIIDFFKLDSPRRTRRKLGYRALRKYRKELKGFRQILQGLDTYANNFAGDDAKITKQLQGNILNFNRSFPGGFKYHLQHFLRTFTKLQGSPYGILSLYEGHAYTVNTFNDSELRLNKGPGREEHIVMNSMMSHMPLVFSNRLKELGGAMSNIQNSEKSELFERSAQFETYLKPLLKTCSVLSSLGTLNQAKGNINAGIRVNKDLHQLYREHCAPFFCEDGNGLQVFSRNNALSDIPRKSIITPDCPQDDEQCIIQHYKRMSCKEDDFASSLFDHFERKYEDQGTVCGRLIKNKVRKSSDEENNEEDSPFDEG